MSRKKPSVLTCQMVTIRLLFNQQGKGTTPLTYAYMYGENVFYFILNNTNVSAIKFDYFSVNYRADLLHYTTTLS